MSFFRSKTFIALSILTVAGGVGTFVHVNALVSWEESIRNPAKVGTSGFSAGTFAKDNGLFLVSTDRSQVNFWSNKFSTNKSKSGSENTLVTRSGEAPTDAFSLVTKAFSDDVNDRTALNRMCESAYKASDLTLPTAAPTTSSDSSQTTTPESSVSTDSDLIPEELVVSAENIWHFCAPKIVTLPAVSESETKSSSSKIKDSQNRKTLVDTSDSNNEWFWKLRDSEFWNTQQNLSRSGSKAQSDSLFKKLYTDNQNKSEKPSIKDTCKQAYEQDSSSEPNNTDTFLFCSLYKVADGGDE